ncbi:hypothetical protein CH063_07205 [Colletotrichum higginsianum]|uniref:Uncharacterized protein n=1 Tax=Colletotrichum higginsianum (strain IMI 349063) TaxID=759273 RepID=H1V5A9_COLHI|nr:hypothetical protein CH063_07205 [Colletotrichum higginsianum]
MTPRSRLSIAELLLIGKLQDILRGKSFHAAAPYVSPIQELFVQWRKVFGGCHMDPCKGLVPRFHFELYTIGEIDFVESDVCLVVITSSRDGKAEERPLCHSRSDTIARIA